YVSLCFFQAEDGIRDPLVTGVQTCALPIYEECNIRTRAALEKDPVKVRLLTGLPFRHWDEWRTNIRHHVFVADLDTGEARDVTRSEERRVGKGCRSREAPDN